MARAARRQLGLRRSSLTSSEMSLQVLSLPQDGGGRQSRAPPRVNVATAPAAPTGQLDESRVPAGPPPQIRILKRPTSNGVVSGPNSASRPALPVKSLVQREAEYAHQTTREVRTKLLSSDLVPDTKVWVFGRQQSWSRRGEGGQQN